MFTLILTIVVVACVIGLQIYFFTQTRNNIKRLRNFFPNVNILTLKSVLLPSNVLRSAERLDSFVADFDVSDQEDVDDDDEDLQMVSLISETEDYDNDEFAEVVVKTNKYLCKNH